jgi:uncharacterized protein
MNDQTQLSTVIPATVTTTNTTTTAPPEAKTERSSSNNSNSNMPIMASGPLTCHALRLPPGSDVVQGIQDAAQRAMVETNTQSCCILTAVGSLSEVTLRMASAAGSNDHASNHRNHDNDLQAWNERMELISLVGTLTFTHKHLHMSVSDQHGTVFGGHVMAGTVFTTLELVLGTIGGVAFRREMDPQTGYGELVVSQTSHDDPQG